MAPAELHRDPAPGRLRKRLGIYMENRTVHACEGEKGNASVCMLRKVRRPSYVMLACNPRATERVLCETALRRRARRSTSRARWRRALLLTRSLLRVSGGETVCRQCEKEASRRRRRRDATQRGPKVFSKRVCSIPDAYAPGTCCRADSGRTHGKNVAAVRTFWVQQQDPPVL